MVPRSNLGERVGNPELVDYSEHLKPALIDPVADGIISGDLKGKTTNPDSEKVVDMYGFLDAVDCRLS